ncbi:SGNH/GDSL hydrolase family protein [Spongiactinospora sp. TRM90649]|uniref:SGNH/GDSL hydrolase family protein n=1 Tax=Spongiactinospora sp. TRM90649 TaxID=3031114 RepID=UPI0023F75756|nr:SGNH/GDSL hydrolase family protein [Spongiactinospora sp. TRM90649]MDF5756237.1 SGNH/GDSL hydrolase family protein [Spongiactinospora sp. TRM90649]
MKLLLSAIAVGALVSVPGTAAMAATATGSGPRALNVVAMGDSYGSGTGAGDYQPGTEGNCWRSANSYSEVVVRELREQNRPVKFTNATCSGATTKHLRESFKGQAPQLDALAWNTDVVLLSIGTNDIGYAGYGGICMQADCTGAPTSAILDRMPAMRTSVKTALADIRARSPRAQIVLTGYGQQVTPGENAADVPLDPICGANVFSAQERVEGNRVAAALDGTLSGAARWARAHGVRVKYVSPYTGSGEVRPEFEGHSQCEAEPTFYRGFDSLAPGQEGQEAVLHLNQPGQAALADLVRDRVPALRPAGS